MAILILGHVYLEKVFSIGVGLISRNRNPHQIEPTDTDFIHLKRFFSKIWYFYPKTVDITLWH